MKKTWESKFDLRDTVCLIVDAEEQIGMITYIGFNGNMPLYSVTWSGASTTTHYEYELKLCNVKNKV